MSNPEEYQSELPLTITWALYLNANKYALAKLFSKGLKKKRLSIQKPYVYALLLDNSLFKI
jgi:hypothetical protein